MTKAELTVKYGKEITQRITSRQWRGDDGYSWAVFIDQRVYVNGLTRREVPYYVHEACKKLAGIKEYY